MVQVGDRFAVAGHLLEVVELGPIFTAPAGNKQMVVTAKTPEGRPFRVAIADHNGNAYVR